MERREDNNPYFCTPKGASIFGWAGVDGIHFCFVRDFGGMVFSVIPMNSAPDFVHPLANDFEDFLRLLLACSDSAALEHARRVLKSEKGSAHTKRMGAPLLLVSRLTVRRPSRRRCRRAGCGQGRRGRGARDSRDRKDTSCSGPRRGAFIWLFMKQILQIMLP